MQFWWNIELEVFFFSPPFSSPVSFSKRKKKKKKKDRNGGASFGYIHPTVNMAFLSGMSLKPLDPRDCSAIFFL